MRFIERPRIEPLFKETKVTLSIDNRYRGDILKQLKKITDLSSEYNIEIKKKRTEEGSGAQGYIWSLIYKIADKRDKNPVRMYKDLVKKTMKPNVVYFENMIEAQRSKEEWEDRGIGFMVLHMTDYKEYVKVKRVRGYSGWNFEEIEKFIRELEKECNSLGIKLEG